MVTDSSDGNPGGTNSQSAGLRGEVFLNGNNPRGEFGQSKTIELVHLSKPGPTIQEPSIDLIMESSIVTDSCRLLRLL